jgi:hypothetical protein
VRQWVCSWLRYEMGYDRRLCADVLAVFIAALRRSLRHRAKLGLGRSVDDAQVGALTFVQRGDFSLRLNVHHTLALDGVYVRDVAGVVRLHALPTPTPEHVAEVAVNFALPSLGVLVGARVRSL